MCDKTFAKLKRDARSASNSHWHIAVPCDSFSRLNVNLNSGTRTTAAPEGDGTLPREILGNKLLERSLTLIRLLLKADPTNTFSLENPGPSLLFHMKAVKRLLMKPGVGSYTVDQCMHGLRLPGDAPQNRVRKRSKFIGNIDMTSLCTPCDGSHPHTCYRWYSHSFGLAAQVNFSW